MKKIIRYKHPISGILGHYPAGMDSEVMEAMLARGSSAMDAAPRTIAPVAQDAVSRLTDSEMAMVKEAIKSVRTPARSAAPVAQDRTQLLYPQRSRCDSSSTFEVQALQVQSRISTTNPTTGETHYESN